jgi:hypothetical protein
MTRRQAFQPIAFAGHELGSRAPEEAIRLPFASGPRGRGVDKGGAAGTAITGGAR